MAVYPGMKPMLDFTQLPSRTQGRVRKRKKAVKTPENPRVRSICLSQGEGAQVTGTTEMKWVSPQFDGLFQSTQGPMDATSTTTTCTAVGRRRKKVANPLQVNVPGPKPRRGKENAPKRTVPTQQAQRKTVSLRVARSGRDPLQRVDGNLIGTEKQELHMRGTEPRQKSGSTTVSKGTKREKAAPPRQHTCTSTAVLTDPAPPDKIEDVTSDLEDFSINDHNMEFEQPPLTTLAGFTTKNPQPASSKTNDYRHPSEVSNSPQQPSDVGASWSPNLRTSIISHPEINKDAKPGGDSDGVEATTISQTPAARLKSRKDITRQGPLTHEAADQKRASSANHPQECDSEERVNNLSNMVSDMSLEDAKPDDVKIIHDHPAVIPGTHSWTSKFEISSFRPPLASTPYHNTRSRHSGSIVKGYLKPMQLQDFHTIAGNDNESTALHSQACGSMDGTVFAPETPACLWDSCGGTRLRPVAVRDNETWRVGDSFS